MYMIDCSQHRSDEVSFDLFSFRLSLIVTSSRASSPASHLRLYRERGGKKSHTHSPVYEAYRGGCISQKFPASARNSLPAGLVFGS
jgi:hypothetical protein